MARGTVLSLHRWPVKSLAGEPARALRFDERGVAGDRAQALYDVHKGAPRRLTAREAPRMLAWGAAYPDAPDAALDPTTVPLPRLTAPDGHGYVWGDAALPAALGADLGRPVELRRDLQLMQDLGFSLLVTVEASLRAVEAALGRPLDVRRLRPNVHVRLDAPAFAEEGWEGRRLRLGDAELELLLPCERCVIPTRDPDTQQKWAELLRWLNREHRGLLGINARAHGPGEVGVGDPVEVL